MNNPETKNEINPKAIQLIFNSIDLNKNGKIEYKEFVSATIRKTLFKDMIVDEESMEIVDMKDNSFENPQEDSQMYDDEEITITKVKKNKKEDLMGSGLVPKENLTSNQSSMYLR